MRKKSERIIIDVTMTTEDKVHYATTLFIKNLDDHGIDIDKIESSRRRRKNEKEKRY